MKKFLLSILLSFAVVLGSSVAHAVVLTFDDLPDIPPTPDEPAAPVGSYGGLTWTNMGYLDPAELSVYLGIPNSGYSNGLVSPNHVAFNWEAALATVTGATFDFNGVYLAGAWNNDLNIMVEGWSGGSLLYTSTVTVDTTAATWFNFNYQGIDKLSFNSFGGTSASYGGWGPHFVMDNFTFNEVAPIPEPETYAMLLAGLGLLGFTARRRKGFAA